MMFIMGPHLCSCFQSLGPLTKNLETVYNDDTLLKISFKREWHCDIPPLAQARLMILCTSLVISDNM